MHLLDCPSQDYAWGTAYDIPSFLGRAATGQPMAEIWMGTHPLGPAMVQGPEGRVPLSDLAGEVPFMMKILSAAKPLSIQVHPNAELARSPSLIITHTIKGKGVPYMENIPAWHGSVKFTREQAEDALQALGASLAEMKEFLDV